MVFRILILHGHVLSVWLIWIMRKTEPNKNKIKILARVYRERDARSRMFPEHVGSIGVQLRLGQESFQDQSFSQRGAEFFAWKRK